MKGFQDLQLAVLIALVLEHLLDRYCLASLRYSRFEDHAERAISHDFLRIVGQALYFLVSTYPKNVSLPWAWTAEASELAAAFAPRRFVLRLHQTYWEAITV